MPNVAVAGKPAVEGYADYETYRLQLESIAQSEFVTLQSLGRTRGKREVYLLTVGSDRPHDKPAMLIVGSAHPPHLLGSELAVRLARRLADQAESDKKVRAMLGRVTFYVIPRPAPDACEAFFRRPYFERSGNERPIDDDRDGRPDEDGPDDLDGDGWITTMRVADPTGPYMSHPEDSRVLIKADAKRDQRGRYSLYVEGRDNDEDDQQGEDPAGGVAFNRNFTFRYPYFERGAGPHQVSEAETRAVADFAFSHRNIAAVLTFTPEDNLMRPWKPDKSSESKPIKTAVLSADAPYFDFVAEQYREIHGGKDPPESPQGQGSLSEWAYFHYGRWSFACRGWWIPQVEPEQKEEEEAEDSDEQASKNEPAEEKLSNAESSETKPSKKKPADDKSEEDKRGAEDLNALRWFAREKIEGFADWKPIAHPDFPERKVEVGGFKPLVRLNPPADRLDSLAEKHCRFVRRLVKLLPRVAIQETKVEPLGEGVWRVTAVVVNQGYLPTQPEMGRLTRIPQVLQIQLELPDGAELVTGHRRVRLEPLAGRGGKAEQTWLVRAPRDKRATLKLRVWSPSVGTKVSKIKLGKPKRKEGEKLP
jgi:hypothetical protein